MYSLGYLNTYGFCHEANANKYSFGENINNANHNGEML